MGITIRRAKKELRYETELAPSVWKWLNAQGAYPVDEFEAPWGITDFFGIRPNLDKSLQRVASGQIASVGNDQSVLILLSIPAAGSGESVDEKKIIKEFSYLIGERRVSSILLGLKKRRFISISRGGQISKNTSWMPYHERMWSVELKLSRVDEALTQAKRHLKITPFSYVGLPPLIAEKTASSAKAKEFETAGVGLLSVTPNSCTALIEPAGNFDCVDNVYATAAAEKCWAAILKAIQH